MIWYDVEIFLKFINFYPRNSHNLLFIVLTQFQFNVEYEVIVATLSSVQNMDLCDEICIFLVFKALN